MPRFARIAASILLVTEACKSSPTSTPALPPPNISAAEVAQQLAEMPDIGNVRLSPDGAWLVYSVSRGSTTSNETKSELRLQRIPVGDVPLDSFTLLPKGASAIQWCPDSRCLSMLFASDMPGTAAVRGMVRYDIATKAMRSIPLRDTAAGAGAVGARPRITVVPSEYQWSPRGNYIAFMAPTGERTGVDPRKGVTIEGGQAGTRTGVFVLDLSSGIVSQITPDSIHLARLGGFAWSPDERELALTIDRELDSQGMNTDIAVVDRETRAVRPLVTRPARDGSPRWSPDGKWIAFATHDEERSYLSGWPAFVPAQGGQIVKLPREGTPTGFSAGWWAPDSKAFFYETRSDMAQPIVRAEVASAKVARIYDPEGTISIPYDENRSVSADGKLMAYTRESMVTPPELFIVALNANGSATGKPRQITQLSPDFPLGKLMTVDTLSWPSRDKKWTVHALLLLPRSAQDSAGRVTSPLPTIVSYIGGPSMVRRGFASDGFHGAQIAAAARGYAVLVPNTRGRAGYGIDFERAIGTEKIRGKHPLDDALGGLDLLVSRGITDSSKTGVMGHSYGGYMTAYTITQTNRFKAAVIHEGVPFYLMVPRYFGFKPGDWVELLARDLYGVHNPFDPAERARLEAESPGLNVDKVKTPTLLQYGAKSAAEDDGIPFYHSLRRFNVPAAIFLYDEGHVFNRPAAVADDLTRTIEWLDFWVRGIPYPDPTRAAEYEGYKKH
jgi:dipeptidyl aminopeptidase/acylaminoacyl peptidase